MATVLFGGATSAFADYAEPWYYEVADEQVTITGYDNLGLFHPIVTVPDTIGGYPVTAIGSYVFAGHYYLESIILPASITTIGAYAFSGPSGLESIILPDNVTTMGVGVFYSCTSLTSIDLPANLTHISDIAFYNCTELESITLPDSVMTIGGSAFDSCTKLTNIAWPANLTTIGDFAFQYCTSLMSITPPDSVTHVGNCAFRGCTSLTDIDLPDYLTTIGDVVFFGCTSLESITLPDSVTTIRYAAFSGCTKLKSITWPDNLTTIGEEAFFGCTSLESITLPATLTTIGDYAFRGCSGLTSITLPDNLTSIGAGVFHSCAGLTSMTWPANLTTIGAQVFYGCTSLTSITPPANLTSIGVEAFSGCTSLTSITLPASLTTIGDRAFYDNSLSWVVFLGNAPTSTGTNIFSGLSALTVYVLHGSTGYGTVPGYWLLNGEFVPPTAYADPTVSTAGEASSITLDSASVGGNVISAGLTPVNASGVCWSTTSGPTTAGSHTTDGSGAGEFTSAITGLSSGTTYYARAYATNSYGTTYGDEISFSTTSPDTTPPVTTLSVSGATANAAGWYTTVPTLALSTEEGASTYYKWGASGEEKSVADNGQPVVVEGENTLYYWSVDAALNAETAQTRVFKLDYTAPGAPELSLANTGLGTATLSWTAASDTGGSGLSHYAIYKDASLVATTAATTMDASGLSGGEVYQVKAMDVAGNETASNSATVGTFALEQKPTGTGVSAGEVTLNFDSMWTTGTPTVSEATLPGTLPTGGVKPLSGAYYDISTTGTFSGSAKVTLSYSDAGMSPAEESSVGIYHYHDGTWTEITDAGQPDTTANTVTGTTTSFSGFGVFYTQDAGSGSGGTGDDGGDGDGGTPVVSTPASSGWSIALLALLAMVSMGIVRRHSVR